METGEIAIIQKIRLSFLNDNVTLVYDEEPLQVYEAQRKGMQSDLPYKNALFLREPYGPEEITKRGEPCRVSAETFLKYWKRDMESVPAGWYHFTNKAGMDVFIDNVTGSGHIKAFDNPEDGIDWIEEIRRESSRSHRELADRGFGAFSYPGFDGRDADGTISTCTVPASYQELDQLCRDHGWMLHATGQQWNKLFTANDCGWPMEHIATMILMCSESKSDYPDPGFAMEQKQILGVLTQYKEVHQYEQTCIERRLEQEMSLDDIEIEDPDRRPAEQSLKNTGPKLRR